MKQLRNNGIDVEAVPKELESAGEGFHYKSPKSSQYYQVVSYFKQKWAAYIGFNVEF